MQSRVALNSVLSVALNGVVIAAACGLAMGAERPASDSSVPPLAKSSVTRAKVVEPEPALPQTTPTEAFSYQGRLSDGGVAYSGNADMLFTIYDSQAGGNALSPTTGIGAVPVSNGIFSTTIPADPTWFFNAPDRYLGIQVRTPAGSGPYQEISPRQRMTPVPTAMVANLAESALTAQTATFAGTAQSAVSAQNADHVPWSGVTGVPAALANTPRVYSVFYKPTSTTTSTSTFPGKIPGSIQTFNCVPGVAIINWTLTCWSGDVGRLDFYTQSTSVAQPFYFNQSGVHMTVSGTAVVSVAGGNTTFQIWVARSGASGTFIMDAADSLSYTIINLPQ
ncbi:MAG: hypothetical protein ACREJD_16245 [Phycisphaerales bacterium]